MERLWIYFFLGIAACRLAFGLALDPSIAWVSPFNRLVFHQDHFSPLGQLRHSVVNREFDKTGQV
jgi:hypothetical protein